MNQYAVLIVLGMFSTLGCGGSGEPKMKLAQTVIDDSKNPIVALHTNRGVIRIELFEDVAPNTVSNFVKLAGSGFYDGTSFHRVIKGFMMQGGCPNTKNWNVFSHGKGGPGYQFADEHSREGALPNLRGYVSMANAGPNTNGSQFFILFKDAPHLNQKHTVFGLVSPDSKEIIDDVEQNVAPDQGQSPRSPLTLVKAHVERRRGHDYEPSVVR